MRPRERRDGGQNDFFKARLDQIADMNHPLAKLGRTVDWGFLEKSFGAVYSDGPGQPPLPTRPYDGHTLGTAIPEIEKQIGVSLKRIFCDAGYKGHNAPQEHRFKVYTAGQKRKMTDAIKREMRRRAAIEPLIGHAKSDHRMGRNYLAGQAGDAINAILAAVGYNFRRLLAWLALLLSTIWLTLLATNRSHPAKVAA